MHAVGEPQKIVLFFGGQITLGHFEAALFA